MFNKEFEIKDKESFEEGEDESFLTEEMDNIVKDLTNDDESEQEQLYNWENSKLYGFINDFQNKNIDKKKEKEENSELKIMVNNKDYNFNQIDKKNDSTLGSAFCSDTSGRNSNRSSEKSIQYLNNNKKISKKNDDFICSQKFLSPDFNINCSKNFSNQSTKEYHSKNNLNNINLYKQNNYSNPLMDNNIIINNKYNQNPYILNPFKQFSNDKSNLLTSNINNGNFVGMNNQNSMNISGVQQNPNFLNNMDTRSINSYKSWSHPNQNNSILQYNYNNTYNNNLINNSFISIKNSTYNINNNQLKQLNIPSANNINNNNCNYNNNYITNNLSNQFMKLKTNDVNNSHFYSGNLFNNSNNNQKPNYINKLNNYNLKGLNNYEQVQNSNNKFLSEQQLNYIAFPYQTKENKICNQIESKSLTKSNNSNNYKQKSNSNTKLNTIDMSKLIKELLTKSKEQPNIIIEINEAELYCMSCTKYGCKTLVKILKKLSPEEIVKIKEKIKPYYKQIYKKVFGSIFMEGLVDILPKNKRVDFIEDIKYFFKNICLHKCGYHIIKTLIESSSKNNEDRKKEENLICDLLLKNFKRIAFNRNGSIIISKVIQFYLEENTIQILEAVIENSFSMTINSFAINVIKAYVLKYKGFDQSNNNDKLNISKEISGGELKSLNKKELNNSTISIEAKESLRCLKKKFINDVSKKVVELMYCDVSNFFFSDIIRLWGCEFCNTLIKQIEINFYYIIINKNAIESLKEIFLVFDEVIIYIFYI